MSRSLQPCAEQLGILHVGRRRQLQRVEGRQAGGHLQRRAALVRGGQRRKQELIQRVQPAPGVKLGKAATHLRKTRIARDPLLRKLSQSDERGVASPRDARLERLLQRDQVRLPDLGILLHLFRQLDLSRYLDEP